MNRQPASFVLTVAAWLATGFYGQLNAAPANEAWVSHVKNRVQLQDAKNAPRRALANDIVPEQTVVQTSDGSRTELTFSDETVVRLAARTAFDFNRGTRGLNLKEGAVLIEAPKSARGATIRAGNIAAVVTGTTVMVEYHPGVYKVLVLEGTGRLYRPGHLGDSILVTPGQMVIGNPNEAISEPVDVDIDRFLKTSGFIKDFPPLRGEKLIVTESRKQLHEKSNKTLIGTNMVIFGGGTQVSVNDQQQADTPDRKTAALVMPHRAPNLSPNAAPALPQN
ncbi:MAG TPA: FecR family protein [Candidatus Udaeobacter sp.]|nr:FecR family protein [Candidatus Udaeobacter sp.]